MNSAAARAARRRGTSNRISAWPQGSESSAGATFVVLPAPGGATSNARVFSRSAARRSGRTNLIGYAALISAGDRELRSLGQGRLGLARREHRQRVDRPAAVLARALD